MNNLRQTLRFLEKRERKLLSGEVVLVCQDDCDPITTDFRTTRVFSLGVDSYCKTVMCNIGVKMARNERVILMDSDRILPENYFSKNLDLLKKGIFLSTKFLYSLEREYSDEEIEQGEIRKIQDFRSENIAGRKKNLFSGNTMMMRKDYLECGGMDEEFMGYGFEDNDMAKNIISKGHRAIYLEEEELHLFHEKEIEWKKKIMNSNTFKILSCINALKYCKKWNINPDEGIKNMILEIKKDLGNFPKDLQEEFQERKMILKRRIRL